MWTALLSPMAAAGTFDVPASYATVDEAVEAANRELGPHTIRIAAGTYSANVELAEDTSFEVFGAGLVTLVNERADADEGIFNVSTDVAVTVTGFTLDGNGGRVVVVNDGAFTLDGATVVNTGGSRDGGAVLQASGTTAVIRASSFGTSVGTPSNGGFVYTEGELSLTDVDFGDGVATGNGGAVWFGDGVLTIEGGQFSRNTAAWGGALFMNRGELTISGAAFVANQANGDRGGGAIYAESPGSFTVSDSTFSDNGSTGGEGGGAVYLRRTAQGMSFARNRFERNHTDEVGGAILQWSGNFEFHSQQNLFCSNTAGRGGGFWLKQGVASLENDVFLFDSATSEAGAVGMESGTLTAHHLSVYGASAGTGGQAVSAGALGLTIEFSHLQGHLGAALDASVDAAVRSRSNLFWDNSPDFTAGVDDAGSSFVDPLLFRAVSTSACQPIELYPVPNSPLIGAGSDGSTIGAFGGASPYPSADVDGDEYPPPFDCDDEDSYVLPGVPELVGDEVDQDCDGQELCYLDSDGDGDRVDQQGVSPDPICSRDEGLATSGALIDCNDGDESVHHLATEQIADNVDQNCDREELCYLDDDGDGLGNPDSEVASAVVTCDSAGVSPDDTDPCPGDPANACELQGDADTDADTDSDADTDADTDADSDTDTDSTHTGQGSGGVATDPGCGCASGPTSAAGIGWSLALALCVRRRR